MTSQEVTPANIEKVKKLSKLLFEAQEIAEELQKTNDPNSLQVYFGGWVKVSLAYAIMQSKCTAQDYQDESEDLLGL